MVFLIKTKLDCPSLIILQNLGLTFFEFLSTKFSIISEIANYLNIAYSGDQTANKIIKVYQCF